MMKLLQKNKTNTLSLRNNRHFRASIVIIFTICLSVTLYQRAETPTPTRGQLHTPRRTTTTNKDCTSRKKTVHVDELDLRVRGGKDKITFLHVGKGGGGTVQDRLDNAWRILYRHCHPNPCPHVFDPSPPDYVEPRLTFVSVRDPIDRFVSAFYYMMLIQCKRTGETRTPTSRPNEANDASGKFCFARQTFFEILDKYESNASHLAEALCSADNNEAAAARKDLETIPHLTNNLSQWLMGDKWQQIAPTLVPIAFEKGFDLKRQLDDAVDWAQHYYKFEDDSGFSLRGEHVRQMDCDGGGDASATHSSQGASGNKKNPRLSKLGVSCVAHYYAQDYEMINQLKDTACKTHKCQQALQSIMNRRAVYLNDGEKAIQRV